MHLLRSMKKFLSGLMIGALLLSATTYADNTAMFRLIRNNAAASELVGDVEYLNGRFVSVGESGSIRISTDGQNWNGSAGQTASYQDLRGVTWGNGLYIAAGDAGTILQSPDGINWICQQIDLNAKFNDIAYGNKRFVVVGDNGEIRYSSDGRSWTKAGSPVKTRLRTVIWDGKQFICAGLTNLLTSNDGVTWNSVKTEVTENINDILWDGKQYVAVGSKGFIGVSQDLQNWKRAECPQGAYLNVAYGNGVYVAGGLGLSGNNRGLVYSKDALHWSIVENNGAKDYSCVSWGNGVFVAVGTNEKFPYVTFSENGEIWSKISFGYDTDFYDIVKSKEMMISVGTNGALYRSKDGNSWTKVELPVSNTIYTIAAGNGRYVAYAKGSMLTSINGIQWTSTTIDTEVSPFYSAWGNNVFVAVDLKGKIYVSPDGVKWSQNSIQGISSVSGLTYGKEGFALLDILGKVYTSPDGVHWTIKRKGEASLEAGASYRGIYFANGQFFCFRYSEMKNNRLIFSKDGVTWTEKELSYKGTATEICDLGYGDGKYAAVGNNGRILWSKDGLNWTWIGGGANNQLKGIVWNDGKFISVGNNGTILSLESKSSSLEITSKVYKVDKNKKSIEGIPAGTTYKTLKDNLKLANGAYISIAGKTDVKESEVLTNGTRLIVMAENRVDSFEYTLIVGKAKK